LFPIRDINPTRITPLITVGLIVVNVVVFFFWQPQADLAEQERFLYERAAVACELTTGEPLSVSEVNSGVCVDGEASPAVFPDKNVWLSALVSMFLHGSLLHIGGNMWFLWIFGNNVEEAYGPGTYLLVYLLGGVAATATFVVANPDATVPLVGASGAIAAVLGSYLVLYPTHRVLSVFIYFFVQVPAALFLGIWFVTQFAISDESVAWEAHVGGFVFGVVVTLLFRSVLLRRVEGLHATTRFPGVDREPNRPGWR
jgi:membrane associated rhomboid family serine protease